MSDYRYPTQYGKAGVFEVFRWRVRFMWFRWPLKSLWAINRYQLDLGRLCILIGRRQRR